MNSEGKVLTIALIIFLALALSFSGWGFYSFQKERAMTIALQGELDAVKLEKKKVEMKVQELGRMNSDLDGKVREAQARIDSLVRDLDSEKSAKQMLVDKTKELNLAVDKQAKLNEELSLKVSDFGKTIDVLKDKLKEVNDKNVELKNKLSEFELPAESAVALGKIVVSPEQGAPEAVKPGVAPAQQAAVAKTEEGRVMVVNKDYNFAVINLGSENGIEVGDVFSIYRGSKYLGDVKVEKLHSAMSAAGFMSPDLKNKVAENDKIVLKK